MYPFWLSIIVLAKLFQLLSNPHRFCRLVTHPPDLETFSNFFWSPYVTPDHSDLLISVQRFRSSCCISLSVLRNLFLGKIIFGTFSSARIYTKRHFLGKTWKNSESSRRRLRRRRVDGGLRRKHLSFLGFCPFLVIGEMRELLLPLFQKGHRVELETHLTAYSREIVFAGPRRGKTRDIPFKDMLQNMQ